MKRVAIIGGGIAGLSACLALVKALDKYPTEIILYEASNRLGGHVHTIHDPSLDLTVEAGPDSILARKPASIHLLKSLHLEHEIVHARQSAGNIFIVRDGKLHKVPNGYMGIPCSDTAVESNLLSREGKQRVLAEECLPVQDVSVDMSLGAFLRGRLGDEWVEYIGEPLLAGLYAGAIDKLSLLATWPFLVNLMREHGSLVAASRVIAMVGRSSSTTGGFVSVRGGLELIIERMLGQICEHRSADIRLGARVLSITKDGHRYRVTAETEGGNRTVDDVDGAIITVPSFVAQSILKPILELPDTGVFYQSTATVVLVYERHAIDIDLEEASGFLVPRPEGMTITATTWVSSKWPHISPPEYAVIRAYVGRRDQDQALTLSDADLVRSVTKEVGKLLGTDACPIRHYITRFDKAMPNYAVHHLCRVEKIEATLKQKCPGIFLAGAGYRGVGLPDCVEQGTRAAEHILASLFQV
ncbi:protoporphyrinogen oxidase [Alicyclobacillus acidocaldarius]|uniref:Coproporphyrinogen III oxidase n=1 Tax=Alicyclobacillus acidocaldarius subsp. acidocaldarius (strain ATCC 27009 / DSM 446 / BCRC 14685 / JCM 5260 / KCTC 1825 / NBRC 15652 / NCIMB 11725 / NRRL B-14509 / 104-IA) TaxID=521098 RepID=C8WSR9_ALIAD|nr:protoporphyrinogen oxidase [Alicyclobacillus acidocaldarius]ACV57575.1 protoporphyrinogen oxidase [Alicyclobacillus acidocaldarius subsp. acidocaldarius DSM 446]